MVVPISGNEFLVLLVLAAVLIGPERMPGYARQLGNLVRELRRMASGAQSRIAAELGPEMQDVDWSQLDPRRYDPRRIVREALFDEAPGVGRSAPGGPVPGGRRFVAADPATPAPFDDEAT